MTTPKRRILSFVFAVLCLKKPLYILRIINISRNMLYVKCSTVICFRNVLRNSSGNVLPTIFYKLQIQDFIIEKIASLQVKRLPDLLQISSVIGSAIHETENSVCHFTGEQNNIAGGCWVGWADKGIPLNWYLLIFLQPLILRNIACSQHLWRDPLFY